MSTLRPYNCIREKNINIFILISLNIYQNIALSMLLQNSFAFIYVSISHSRCFLIYFYVGCNYITLDNMGPNYSLLLILLISS